MTTAGFVRPLKKPPSGGFFYARATGGHEKRGREALFAFLLRRRSPGRIQRV
jgi:hypothetical protein